MRKRDLLKQIGDEARAQKRVWALLRQGANHEVWILDGVRIPIPRHSEVGEMLAVQIFKQCESKLGEGWWR